MVKLNKRVIACLSLIISAVIVFSGCGSKQGKGASNAPADTTQSTSQETTATASEPEKVHKLKIMGKANFSKYVNWDDREKFPSWQLYEEYLKQRNIELEYELVVPEQYATVVQTRLAAAANLPDIISFSDSDVDDITALNLGKAGVLVELNEAIEKYSDGTINEKYQKKYNFSKQATTSSEGKRYWFANAISWPNLTGDDGKEVPNYGVIGFSIRKDWLDKLGIPMPQNLDEWKAALRAFRDKDVNGSKDKDEVILYDPYSYSFFTGIAQWFGLVPDIVAYDPATDKITSPWYQPGVKEYFKLLNELAN